MKYSDYENLKEETWRQFDIDTKEIEDEYHRRRKPFLDAAIKKIEDAYQEYYQEAVKRLNKND